MKCSLLRKKPFSDTVTRMTNNSNSRRPATSPKPNAIKSTENGPMPVPRLPGAGGPFPTVGPGTSAIPLLILDVNDEPSRCSEDLQAMAVERPAGWHSIPSHCSERTPHSTRERPYGCLFPGVILRNQCLMTRMGAAPTIRMMPEIAPMSEVSGNCISGPKYAKSMEDVCL